jgi:hypothetical protein
VEASALTRCVRICAPQGRSRAAGSSSSGIWHPTADYWLFLSHINKSSAERFHEIGKASNGASSIDFPVVRCRLSASWIGRFNSSCWAIRHDQSLPFKGDARNKALRT